MGAGDGGEVLGTKLQLNRTGMQAVLAQAAADHLGEAHERRFELVDAIGVFVESMLVADRFGTGVLADVGVKPAAGVFAARLAGESQAPLSETIFEKMFLELAEIADLADAHRMQILLHCFADAGNVAHIERREAPMPIEQLSCVSSLTFACREWAARMGGPCKRSVPVMSR